MSMPPKSNPLMMIAQRNLQSKSKVLQEELIRHQVKPDESLAPPGEVSCGCFQMTDMIRVQHVPEKTICPCPNLAFKKCHVPPEDDRKHLLNAEILALCFQDSAFEGLRF